VKNGGSERFEPLSVLNGGNVKHDRTMRVLAVAALVGSGLLFSGCKSKPPLTAAQAQAMIQAKYDAMPAKGVDITVSDLGMQQGFTAKYWTRTKQYPNKYWADFTLTDEGKKVLKLHGGGDVIQWRPQSPTDNTFVVTVTTVQANHLKARDVQDPQDEVNGNRNVTYTEAVDLTGVPDGLQQIAHDPGNDLSDKKMADFALVNGAWQLQALNE